LCEEIVLEQESKTSRTDKAKVQAKIPPKTKQSKRKHEDFEEASYEEEEEFSDSDGLISSSLRSSRFVFIYSNSLTFVVCLFVCWNGTR
jgi:hypothetical protein